MWATDGPFPIMALPMHLVFSCILTRVRSPARVRAFLGACRETHRLGASADGTRLRADWLLAHRPRRSVLYVACASSYGSRGGESACVSLLMEMLTRTIANDGRGLAAYLDAEEERRAPLLVRVSRFGHQRVVRALLHLGADPNASGELGVTALMVAARHGHREVVDELLPVRRGPGGTDDAAAAANVDAIDSFGNTAAHYAMSGGHEPLARRLSPLLLSQRGDGARDVRSWSPDVLSAAVHGGCGEVACVLLARHRGDDDDDDDGDGFGNALSFAVCGARRGVVRRLLRARRPSQPFGAELLCAAVKRGYVRIAHRMLDAGVDPGAYGAGVLCAAAKRGHAGLLRRLLLRLLPPAPLPPGAAERTAAAVDRDHLGGDALYLAARFGRVKIARQLVRAGTDVVPVLLRGIESQSDDVVRLLLRQGHVDRDAVMSRAAADGHVHLMMSMLQLSTE